MAMTILSQGLIYGLMRRPDFFDKLPEFSQMRTMTTKLDKAGMRCCVKRTIQYNIFAAFTTVLTSLSQPALARFKAYAGIDSLQCQWFNRVTGKYDIRVI